VSEFFRNLRHNGKRSVSCASLGDVSVPNGVLRDVDVGVLLENAGQRLAESVWWHLEQDGVLVVLLPALDERENLRCQGADERTVTENFQHHFGRLVLVNNDLAALGITQDDVIATAVLRIDWQITVIEAQRVQLR